MHSAAQHLGMASDPDTAAARIAARQCGFITRQQARIRAGLTDRQIHGRVQSKRWRRLQRNVYLAAGVPPSWEQSLLAAQLSARTEQVVAGSKTVRLEELDDAVVSGRSALLLHGCTRMGRPDQHELLVHRQRVPPVNGTVIRRTGSLPAEDVTLVHGIPTLAVPRLCVELCGQLPEVELMAVVDDLLGGGRRDLRTEVHKRAEEMMHGKAGVRRLVSLTDSDGASNFRSWLERHAASLMVAAGIPPAIWNLEIFDGRELVGIGDAVWPDCRVIVELDGLRFHSSAEQRRRDNRKDRRLGSMGWLVLRYTWLDMVERPDEVTAEITAALRARHQSLRL